MSQKQHQQQCDEAEQQRLHQESVRCYWTPERIRNAIPKCSIEEPIPGKKQQGYGVGDPPKVVSDLKRKEEPYKNVGQIAYKKGKDDYIATAYVAKTAKGNNIVFTAAHNLYEDGLKSEKIMFTPALQSDGSAVPAFGQFSELAPNSWVVSSKWVSTDPYPRQYDIGAIKLGKNAAGKEVGEILPGFEIETEPDAQQSGYVKDKTEWKIIGYNRSDMYESDGLFIELDLQTTQEKVGYVVKRTNSILGGMSGSPWLLKNEHGVYEKANGDHSGSAIGFYAVTPFYSEAKIDDILSKLSNL